MGRMRIFDFLAVRCLCSYSDCSRCVLLLGVGSRIVL